MPTFSSDPNGALANGKMARRLFIFVAAFAFVIAYGVVCVMTPSEQDVHMSKIWLNQLEERINCADIFAKEEGTFRDITVTSHGFYAVVDIRAEQTCDALPKALKVYIERNKIGAITIVRLWAGDDDSPCYTTWF